MNLALCLYSGGDESLWPTPRGTSIPPPIAGCFKWFRDVSTLLSRKIVPK